MKRIMIVVVVVAVAGGAAAWFWLKGPSAGPQFRLAKVEKGDIFVTVTATGTIQPVTQVQVGTQVTGTILRLGADYNGHVKAGQTVAQIDPAQYQARVDQDKANLERADADVDRVKAGLVQAEKELDRAKRLSKRDLISISDLDAAQANYDSLLAQKKVVEATVSQSRASLRISEVNLAYTTIVCPIDGVVISRNVDVGQTVSASLQAPTLFVIADSLKRIQVQASVAEADIGRIADDQKVTFTVDAYRQMKFEGTVAQIRLSPITVQNVVTYTVMINANNPNEKLLPGMTASVTFEVDHQKEALKVPNAALRFTPPPDVHVQAAEKSFEEKSRGRGMRGHVWLSGPKGLTEVEVFTGASDGSFTQILKGDLQEGQEVVAGLVQDSRDSAMTNPFGPTRIVGGGGRPR